MGVYDSEDFAHRRDRRAAGLRDHRRARRGGRLPHHPARRDALRDRCGERPDAPIRSPPGTVVSSDYLVIAGDTHLGADPRRRPAFATAMTATTDDDDIDDAAPAPWLGSIPSPWGDLYLDAGAAAAWNAMRHARRSAPTASTSIRPGPLLGLPDLGTARRDVRAVPVRGGIAREPAGHVVARARRLRRPRHAGRCGTSSTRSAGSTAGASPRRRPSGGTSPGAARPGRPARRPRRSRTLVASPPASLIRAPLIPSHSNRAGPVPRRRAGARPRRSTGSCEASAHRG